MTVVEILSQLERTTEAIPRAALAAAAEQRDMVTPELLRALEHATQNAAALSADDDYQLHVYALYLLAQFREPQAYPRVLRLFSLPGDQPLELTGDVLTEAGSRLLASVCGGDTRPLQQLIEDEAINEYARGQALEAFAVLVAWGETPSVQVLEYSRSLFHGRLTRPGNPHVWAELVGCCCDLGARELLPEIEAAFDAGLVDEWQIDRAHVHDSLVEATDGQLNEFRRRHPPITDTAQEVSWWSCFTGDPSTGHVGRPSALAEVATPVAPPARRATPK